MSRAINQSINQSKVEQTKNPEVYSKQNKINLAEETCQLIGTPA
jgi:hypothetical protein